MVEEAISWKIVTIPLMFLFLFTVLFFFTKYSVWQLKNVALDEMEVQGGYNLIVDQKVNQVCSTYKLDRNNLRITATTGMNNYGSDLIINIEYDCKFKTGSLFNFNAFTIKQTGSLTSEVLVR